MSLGSNSIDIRSRKLSFRSVARVTIASTRTPHAHSRVAAKTKSSMEGLHAAALMAPWATHSQSGTNNASFLMILVEPTFI